MSSVSSAATLSSCFASAWAVLRVMGEAEIVLAAVDSRERSPARNKVPEQRRAMYSIGMWYVIVNQK